MDSTGRRRSWANALVALLAAMVVVAGHQAGGAAAAPGCPVTFFTALTHLLPCRQAVAPFSHVSPNEACCNAVRMLGMPCLCAFVDAPPIAGVDHGMALQLPSKCGLAFPPCPPIHP